MLVIVVLTPGCIQFTSREVRLAERADRFERRSFDRPQLQTFLHEHGLRASADGVWDFESLAIVANYYHPNLDVARAELDAARAAEITAGAKPNPSLGISAARNTSSGAISPWIGVLDFDLPIETAGKRGLRLVEARHRTEAARLRLTSAAWTVRMILRKTLLELADATERTRLGTRQIAKQEEALATMEQKLAAGAIAGRELSLVRSALARLKKEREDARGAAAESRVRVAPALGLPAAALPAEFSAKAEVAADEVNGSREAKGRALTSRADLLAALADYAAAQAVLRLEVAKQFPDVRLGPGYEYDQSENKWSLGFSIELPVFNRNRGPIAEADAKRREAAARVFALQTNIVAEIEQAVAKWEGAKRRLTVFEELVGEQKRQAELAAAACYRSARW